MIDDPACNDVVKELRNEFYNWMEKSNDPILKGRILHPKKQYNK